MELELQRRRGAPAEGDGATALATEEGPMGLHLDGILAEADRILDGLRPINAEEYLQQNRQRGGQ
ncbi:MAG TPA: hypothetical protein VFE78_28665 [Gemmataceae bacterium]|jgi:hypothetical protein|nr:hypothetical protein [Gemmataceae bacterium]